MKKVLITGASGFAGGYLAEHLLSLGDYDICGTYNSDTSLQKSPVKDTIQFKKVNLQDKEQVLQMLRDVQPEWIFHLAALASAGASFKDPVATFHTNIDSEIYLLDSLRELELANTRTLIVSSAEVYGYVRAEDLPVDEETPLRPANPYSVSKIAQDYLAFQYSLSYKLPIIRIRPFNHFGPYQKTGFATSDFAKQIADIEKGIQPPVIKVGNLEAKRDFTDVRDMVRVYPMILEKGTPGEAYNAGSGISHKIQEILDILIASSTAHITVEVDEAKLRPSDVPEIVSDNTKITSVTGWKPEIPFDRTVRDTLEYWRKQ